LGDHPRCAFGEMARIRARIPSDRSGTAVGLIAPATDEGPLLSNLLASDVGMRAGGAPAWMTTHGRSSGAKLSTGQP
jgi:hypothetical protein